MKRYFVLPAFVNGQKKPLNEIKTEKLPARIKAVLRAEIIRTKQLHLPLAAVLDS